MSAVIKQSPAIYIIAGPNGAGKTTFSKQFLPTFVKCREFLNADLIAAGLSPFAPERQNVRAAELMRERMERLIEKRESFAFETTLAARTYAQKIRGWQGIGYVVHLFFLWLPSAELAVQRVANRVTQGGHNIIEPDIRRRYRRGLKNLIDLYLPLVDSAEVLDADGLPPQRIWQMDETFEKIVQASKWELISPNRRVYR